MSIIPTETDYQPEIVPVGGHNLISGLSRVFHCNHYNAYLQMTVLLTQGMPDHDPERLLTDAITPLVQSLKQQGYSTEQLIQEFSYCGFGVLEQIDQDTWQTPSSHYSQAVYSHGKPHKSCYVTSGYIQGLVEKVVQETTCQAEAGATDQFTVLDQPLLTTAYLNQVFDFKLNFPERFVFPECQAFHTRVDEEKIIAAVRELPLYGRANGTGLIDAFGVMLTNHFADYYNRISYETYFALQRVGMPEEECKEMFIQAGHICAFNTFGGVMSSPEWATLVQPMCDQQVDWFHGMIAVLNALGWGVFRLEKINEKQEFIVRVYNSYEGIGYRRMYPMTTDRTMSFLCMGIILGLVHLLWKVDIREKPTLNQDFYVQQFNNPDSSYSIEQTHAIAAGDEYDRFVVSQ